MVETIDYNKLGNMIREIVREELEEVRPLNSKFIKEHRKLELQKGKSFNSITELDNLVKNT